MSEIGQKFSFFPLLFFCGFGKNILPQRMSLGVWQNTGRKSSSELCIFLDTIGQPDTTFPASAGLSVASPWD